MRTPALLLRCLLPALLPALAAATLVDAVRRDTGWIAGVPSRCVGSEGHASVQTQLLAAARAVPGAVVLVQEFPVVVPSTRRAVLALAEGPLAGEHAVHPVWPDLARLKTTPEAGISGRLVYVGAGGFDVLPARTLRGQIAVMEMRDARNWRKPFAMGAAAVLFLGGPEDQAAPPAAQALHKPRYYVPEGPLADALRAGALASARIDCDAAWQTVTARNILVAIPASAGAADLPPLALAAPYDAMSVVPTLAPGADDAVDAALLLALLRRFGEAPPPRPLLFCFVDANGINQLGMRQLLLLLTATPQDPTRRDYERAAQETLAEYRETAALAESLGNGPDALEPLWDKRRHRQLQRAVKDVVGPEILTLRDRAGERRLDLQQAGRAARAGDDAAAVRAESLRAEIDAMTARLRERNGLLAQILTREPLRPDCEADALEVWRQVRARVDGQLAAAETTAGEFAALDQLRAAVNAALGRSDTAGRPVAFVLGFDLSDGGTQLGPGLWCGHLQMNQTVPARDFLRWLKPLLRPDGALHATAVADHAVSFPAVQAMEAPASFNPAGLALSTSPAESFRMPAATWRTVDGCRPRLDTPQDRADRLDWSRLAPQLDFTERLVAQWVADPAFAPAEPAGSTLRPRWRQPNGTLVAESLAETVPRTPRENLLVTFVNGTSTYPGPAPAPGVRRHEFVRTGPDGRFRFPPMACSDSYWVARGGVQAFGLDPRGRVVEGLSVSAGMLAGRIATWVWLVDSPSAPPVRAVTFPCVELDGPLFHDPHFLEPLTEYALRDARRGGAPRRSHFTLHDGQMHGLLPPGTRWQLILRAGSAAPRMTLMNIAADELAAGGGLREAMRVGYAAGEALPSVPEHLAARDFHTVDVWRRDQYAAVGIVSAPIDALLAQSGSLLAAADAALAADDGPALQRAASGALAAELRAYEALRATADDVTRGAVFLLLLLVPFAVAMERLVFACPRIGHRIAAAAAIFLAMTAALWSFHPAFRITSQPMVILMAFAILLMSLVVIVIVMRKFDVDLEMLRSGRAESSGAETGRGGVLGSAIWLGLANMRKRKLRTALTGTTIVLITFALLCFSSATSYRSRRELTLRGGGGPVPGVLIRLPNMQPLHEQAAETVRLLLPGEAVAARYWWTSTEADWRLHLLNPATGAHVSLKGALGLEPAESGASRPERLLPDWPRFARGDGCYLAEETAAALGVKAGETVQVAGHPFTLVGTYDAARANEDFRQLDGQSLLPFDFSVQREASQGREALSAKLAQGKGLQDDAQAATITAAEAVLLPAGFVRERGGTLRSLAVGAQTPAEARALVDRLMDVLAFPMYCSTESGVKAVVATPLIARPPRRLLVPLLIAALIIFNTMLNSVSERKGEIHIYTSLGLAPRHVGALFVAEALTYGLLGTIAGYVLGQGVATALTSLGLMGGITLNYSGTGVVMTMGLVLAVVALSAVVPAIMAGRLATPSRDMRWSVPKPVDGVIADVLPFTVTRAAAKGLVAFIHEFMDAHREGSIGTFTASDLALAPQREGLVAGLSGTVWLAPYDLGVRQGFRVEIVPEAEDDICGIQVVLTQEAGQEKTWWRLNKAFLGDIRRQFLGWRRVPVERMMAYVRAAEAAAGGVNAGG